MIDTLDGSSLLAAFAAGATLFAAAERVAQAPGVLAAGVALVVTSTIAAAGLVDGWPALPAAAGAGGAVAILAAWVFQTRTTLSQAPGERCVTDRTERDVQKRPKTPPGVSDDD